MVEVLEVIRRNKLVLATGHVSKAEVFAITNAGTAAECGVIITHPLADLPAHYSR